MQRQNVFLWAYIVLEGTMQELQHNHVCTDNTVQHPVVTSCLRLEIQVSQRHQNKIQTYSPAHTDLYLQPTKHNNFACCLLHVGFLLGLHFNPEDGGSMLLHYGIMVAIC
jgi:hypothetical protein